ncbi:MAG: 2'-5' RNA ligase family protein [archaeon]
MNKVTIAIIPPKEESREIAARVKDFNKKQGIQHYAYGEIIPHISLFYLGDMPGESIDYMNSPLDLFCLHIQPFEINYGAIHVTDYKTAVINVRTKYKLRNLHNDVVDKFKRFYCKYVSPSIDQSKLSDKELEIVAETGRPYYREFYDPHLTLERLHSVEQIQDAKQFFHGLGNFKQDVTKLSLIVENELVTTIYREYDLRKRL